jgi:hypothetical protein
LWLAVSLESNRNLLLAMSEDEPISSSAQETEVISPLVASVYERTIDGVAHAKWCSECHYMLRHTSGTSVSSARAGSASIFVHYDRVFMQTGSGARANCIEFSNTMSFLFFGSHTTLDFRQNDTILRHSVKA